MGQIKETTLTILGILASGVIILSGFLIFILIRTIPLVLAGFILFFIINLVI